MVDVFVKRYCTENAQIVHELKTNELVLLVGAVA